jgi:hypothetical protein
VIAGLIALMVALLVGGAAAFVDSYGFWGCLVVACFAVTASAGAYLGLLLGQGDPVWVALGGFGGAVLCGLAAVQA